MVGVCRTGGPNAPSGSLSRAELLHMTLVPHLTLAQSWPVSSVNLGLKRRRNIASTPVL